MDVGCAVLERVVDAVIDELEDGCAARGLLEICGVDNGFVDDGKPAGEDVVDDLIDSEVNLAGAVCLNRGAYVAQGGDDDLNGAAGKAVNLIDQKDICGLVNRDGERAFHQKKRED